MELSELRKEILKMKKAGSHFSCLSAFCQNGKLGIVYHFIRKEKPVDLKVIFQPEMVVPSISDIYPSALLYEIEAHELFGIKFDKIEREHLFLPENWKKGYPLRK